MMNRLKGLGMTGRSGSSLLRGSHAPRVLTKQSPDYEVQLGKSEFERDWFGSRAGLSWCSLTTGDAYAGRAMMFKKFAGSA